VNDGLPADYARLREAEAIRLRDPVRVAREQRRLAQALARLRAALAAAARSPRIPSQGLDRSRDRQG
jgi:hypothetical protein